MVLRRGSSITANDAVMHMAKLEAIRSATMRTASSVELHRYYWLEEEQVPEPFENSDSHGVTSDYQHACEDIKEYWADRQTRSDLEPAASDLFRLRGTRDSIGKLIFCSPQQSSPPVNPSLAVLHSKEHHIKRNPVTAFAEALNRQKHMIRTTPLFPRRKK